MDQLEAKKRELAINVNANIADASTQQIQTQQSISAPQGILFSVLAAHSLISFY